jgi:hypothetical protein
VVGADETGSPSVPEIAIARTDDHTAASIGGTCAAGLTKEGRAEFQRLSKQKTVEYETGLEHELTRAWLELRVPGAAEYTSDRVLSADRTLRIAEQQQLIDEVEARVRAEVAGQLQHANLQREEQTKRARLSWRVGAALIAGAAATNAAMMIPGDNLLVKLGVISTTVVGTLIARPPGR